MSSRNRRKKTTRGRASTPEHQLDHLVVMRESGRYDHVLMLGMIQQTLAKVSHLPGATELARAGMDAFHHPERWGGTSRRVGESRMVMIERDGVLYLYSMGTAAKNDLPDTNAFIMELVRVVDAYRPAETWVAAFTRLLRSANYVGDLLRTFSENTRLLHCEAEINIATPEGRMLFQVLAMIAATERDYIVRRHTAGRVAQWRRGEWIPNGFPPGYRLDNRRLVLDHQSIPAVRSMLRLLGDTSLSPSECAARIGGLGITTPKIASVHGDGATVADARNPSDVIDTLVGWADFYATGRHEILWPNPFPGVSDIAGVSVEDHDDYEFGALRFTYDIELPDDGWIDDPTLDAIRSRDRQASPTGGASHRSTSPLAGLFQFTENGFDHSIASVPGLYRLLRRPHLDDRQFSGWRAGTSDDVEWVASVSRSEWHQSIADAVIDAVETGLPAELDAQRFQPTGPLPRLDARRARIRALRRQLDDTTANLARARRNAQLADDDDAAALFVDDVKRHHAEQSQLERELASLEAELDEPELDETFETNAELVAHAFASLANTHDSADSALRDALRTVISRERWEVHGDEVHWEIHIELPHADGTVILGPIAGKVANRRATRAAPTSTGPTRKETARRLSSLGLDQAASFAAAACPRQDLADAIAAHVTGEPLSADIDEGWVRHVADVYTAADFRWNPGRWRLDDDIRRAVLAVLADAEGMLPRSQLVAAGISAHQIRHLSRVTPNAPSGDPVIQLFTHGRDPMYGLLVCPHCGGWASHSIVTPETRPGVLCPDCWRTPDLASPVFPEWYRDPPSTTAQATGSDAVDRTSASAGHPREPAVGE